MDYAFAPGKSDQDERLRIMFPRRANTTLINVKGLRTVQNFIDHLKKVPPPAGVQLPASSLVIGSHANAEGHLFIALDAQAASPIDYDKLKEVEQRGRLKIELTDPPTLIAPGARVHYKGCRIGSQQPFLNLLKEALGGAMQVTAPKYFHSLHNIPNEGIYEAMSQVYEIFRKEPLADPPAVVEAFKQGINNTKFERFGGGAVPDGDWQKWTPSKPGPNLKPADKYQTPLRFPVKLVPSVGTRKAIDDLNYEWRARRAKWIAAPIEYPGRTAPTVFADQMDALNLAEGLKPYNQPDHPYPVYRRLGYDNFQDFIDGHSWTFTAKGPNLNAVGTRFVYTFIIPIVKPGTTDELIFNFYPKGNQAGRIINFDEDNANFDFFARA